MNINPRIVASSQAIIGTLCLGWGLIPGISAIASAGTAEIQKTSPVPDLPYRHLRKIRVQGSEDELWVGTLTVFENRQTRTGRTIDLNILVLPALQQTDKQEPLFELAGGPGSPRPG